MQMKIAKNRLWGLLKIIDHLEEENKTLRDGCIRGYRQYDALKKRYQEKIDKHSAYIARLWRYYKNDEKKDI